MSPDIIALSLNLKPRKSNTLPRWLGRATQAFFLSSLERLDPTLSASIHDGSDMKPFTASTLIGGDASFDGLHLSPMASLRLRYTTLHPYLSLALIHALIPEWQKRGIVIHDQPFDVTSIELNAQTNRWTGSTSFDELLDNTSSEQKTICMTFGSPTAFKSTQGHFIPLPQPELVFGSLLDRWNKFAPSPLPDTLRQVFHDGISVQAVAVKSQEVAFGGGKWGTITGFTGHINYYLKGGSQDTRRFINTLASFACYSGVGVKTTSGLGQVRVD